MPRISASTTTTLPSTRPTIPWRTWCTNAISKASAEEMVSSTRLEPKRAKRSDMEAVFMDPCKME